MTLTASSCLHYFDARYGSIPVIGGAPTFSRNSAGSWVDQGGTLQSAIVNTPRTEWAQLYGEDPSSPATLGKRRPVLRLEQARTNSCTYSNDFSNAAWTASNLTVTTGIADPKGGTSACTLTATASNGNIGQTPAAGASLARTSSVWLKRRTGTGNIAIVNPTDGSWIAVTVPNDGAWHRVSAIGTASTVTQRAIEIVTSGDAVDAFLYQMEDGASMSSGIETTSAGVTRAADSLYFGYTPVPQAAMYYSRHIEQGTLGTGKWLWSITDAARDNPKLVVYDNGGKYAALHHNGTTSAQATLAAAPSIGDTVEILAVLYADGHVDIVQSVNGAAVSSATDATVATPAAAWGGQRLYVNGGGSDIFGLSQFANLKAVKYADVVGATAADRLAELRSFALDSRQGVL